MKKKLHEIIFEADTFTGKLFDIILIVLILASTIIVMLDSIKSFSSEYRNTFLALEWIFTILFTIEYILRIYLTGNKLSYIFSFYGIIDLLAVIPTYLSLIIPGTQYLIVIRILRVLRVFRVLKIVQYVQEARQLRAALNASRRKITVFLFSVFTLVVILGSIMYLVEGTENGFDSIPKSIYWAVVTLTTVGYGDISPQTGLGQFLSAIIMIMGYSIIAVPTGIVSVEMSKSVGDNTQSCPQCLHSNHDDDAKFCKKCGSKLN